MNLSRFRPISTALLAFAVALVGFVTLNIGHSSADPGYHGGVDPWTVAPNNGTPFNFNPVSGVKFCNDLPATVPFTTMGIGGGNGTCDVSPGENLTAGANPDITTFFGLQCGVGSPYTCPAPAAGLQNYNFVPPYLINVVPPAFTITGGQAAGTLMGGLKSTATLGLLGGTCTNTLPVNFILWNIALPNNTAHPWQSTNISFSDADGVSDRFRHWTAGQVGWSGTFGGGATVSFAGAPADGKEADASNQIFGGGNFPEYLLQLLDPAFVPGNPLSTYQNDTFTLPVGVAGGLTIVSGNVVGLMFVQMPAGGLSGFAAPNPFSSFPASLGAPNIAVLQDPTASVASPTPISSFCTPLTSESMLLGSPAGGPVHITSPAAGTGRSGSHLFLTWVESYRDVDADGFQNILDNCPQVANTSQTDSGGFGIGDACAAASPGGTNLTDNGLNCNPPSAKDADCAAGPGPADGFLNIQDNCPFINNPTQAEASLAQAYSVAAPDGGPKTDQIGDPCKTGTVAATIAGNAESINLGAGPNEAHGHYNLRAEVMPKCIGGTPDASGWCSATTGSGRNYTSGTSQNLNVPVTTVTATTGPLGAVNSSFSDFVKTWEGVDPTRPCNHGGSNGGTTQATAVSFWPPDFNNSGKADLTDVVLLKPHFNSSLGAAWGPNPPTNYLQRFDLNGDGNVNLTDVVIMKGVFNQTCTFVGQQ